MTLCVCGHLSSLHKQHDDGEVCVVPSCTCLEYRKTAPKDRPLSAGVTPEGLAEETVSGSVNEAAERLRERLHRDMQHGLAMEADVSLDLALATERRNIVERIRTRAVLASDDYSDDDHKYAEIPLADLFDILDEVGS